MDVQSLAFALVVEVGQDRETFSRHITIFLGMLVNLTREFEARTYGTWSIAHVTLHVVMVIRFANGRLHLTPPSRSRDKATLARGEG